MLSEFAQRIFETKYAVRQGETWRECCERVVNAVLPVGHPNIPHTIEAMYRLKILPGGRYLAKAGTCNPFVSNCFTYRVEDSKEGWGKALSDISQLLMCGGGVGVDYSALRPHMAPLSTGGTAGGPLSLMTGVNDMGRGIRQGGNRRAALLAQLNWAHKDIDAFLGCKPIVSKALRSYLAAAPEEMQQRIGLMLTALPMDMTNISVQYDTSFWGALEDDANPLHGHAKSVIRKNLRLALEGGEPGMLFNYNSIELLTNPCQPAFATVLTPNGIRTMGDIDVGSIIWSGKQWTRVVRKVATGKKEVFRYRTSKGSVECTKNHRVVQNGVKIEVGNADGIDTSVGPRSVTPMRGVVYPPLVMDGLVIGDGSVHKASNSLVYLCVGKQDMDYFNEDSVVANLFIENRHPSLNNGWTILTSITADELPRVWERRIPARFMKGDSKVLRSILLGIFSANGSVVGGRVTLKSTSIGMIHDVQLMLSSLGITSYYTTNKSVDVVHKNGVYTSKESYDLNISAIEEFGRQIGFLQRYKMDKLSRLLEMRSKRKSRTQPASPIIERESLGVHEVYDITVAADEHTYWSGGHLISNCGELRSSHSNDRCNIGTVFLPRCSSIQEFRNCCALLTEFLLYGNIYGWSPLPENRQMVEQNNRILLGLGGMSEWLIQRNLPYSMCSELADWLAAYELESVLTAERVCDELHLNMPAGIRGVAPNGTAAILVGTTGGIEPMYSAAYKRCTWGKDGKYRGTIVIDPLAKKYLDKGHKVWDAFDISFEDRVRFQYEVQKYVDMSISSTINLPSWGTAGNNNLQVDSKLATVLRYSHGLRGLTFYPDAAIEGQPLQRMGLEDARTREGEVVESTFDLDAAEEVAKNMCKGGVCGS